MTPLSRQLSPGNREIRVNDTPIMTTLITQQRDIGKIITIIRFISLCAVVFNMSISVSAHTAPYTNKCGQVFSQRSGNLNV